MRRDQHVIDFCPGSEFLSFEQTSEMSNIGLNNVGSLQLEQRTIVITGVQPFARSNRDRHLFRHLPQRSEVLRWNWLLDPGWLERLQLARHLHGSSRIKAPVHFDEQFGIRADGITYCLHQCYRPVLLNSIEFVEARSERIKLECSVPFLDHTLSCLVKFMGSAFNGIPAVGVSLDPITYRSPEELIDWLTKGLPNDIPTSNLDGCDGGHGDLTGTSVVVAVHAMDQILNIHRIVPKHMIGHSLF